MQNFGRRHLRMSLMVFPRLTVWVKNRVQLPRMHPWERKRNRTLMRTLCVLATAYHLTHANIISGPSSYTIVTQASSRTEVNLPGDKQAKTFAKSPLLDDFHSNRVHDACETGHPVLFWLQQHCGVERGVRTWLGGFGWPDCAWSHTKLGWECHSFVRSFESCKVGYCFGSLPPSCEISRKWEER